jgi:uncharacterized membrane protein YgaE (UPF0421/DUF939 family)
MIASVPHRLAAHLRRRVKALRHAVVPIGQMAVAVGVSWWVANDVFGHTNSYFAPIAAAIVLRVAPGQRTRRAVEMVGGITVGIAVGDLLVREIGVGAWQISLIVTLAVCVAVLLGAGTLIASQAAATAVLVAALPAAHASYTRFTDALIGGVIGLLVVVAAPWSPVAPLRRMVDSFLTETARALAASANALETRDPHAASAALHQAYDIGRLGHSYDLLVQQGQETTRLSPIRWNELPAVDRYLQAAPHIDALARDTRVVCRAVRAAIEMDQVAPAGLPEAIRQLASALHDLPGLLASENDDGELIGRSLDAATAAGECVDLEVGLPINVIVSQLRAGAVDVLRALGVERVEAVAHVRAAGGW